MEETIAELRRQIEEQQRLREAAERREEEERKAREDAERRVQPNSLFHLLDRCHNSLSQAIRVEADATLTTQGDAADLVNRLYPKHIIPWRDFPQLQEQIWDKFDRNNAFTMRPLFPSDTQIDYVVTNIQNRPIYSEASLRNFERDTVDNFVEKVIEVLRDDEPLRDEFGIQGRVTFYDRANPSETSLENSLEQMNLEDARSPQRPANTRRGRGRGRGRGAARRQTRNGTARRRNRRADQFCVHLVADERQIPVYAVEFKAPHKVTIPELVAGLHPIDLDRDVIDQEGDTFEFYATRLVAAVVTQIFSYMIDSGVRYGYICTGEAFVFLHIPKDDPTIIQYFLCIPNQDAQADVQADDEVRLHRTAIGQVLAFTLQALAVEPPTQKWHDVAHDQLTTWKVEYLDVLREIPETLRKDPPASNYLSALTGNQIGKSTTHALALARVVNRAHRHRSIRPLKAAAVIKNRIRHPPQPRRASDRAAAQATTANQPGEAKGHEPAETTNGPLEKTGILRDHTAPLRASAAWLTENHWIKVAPTGNSTVVQDTPSDRRSSHVSSIVNWPEIGRYLIKATLLSRGYTVIMKATTVEKQHRLQTEVDNYRRLRNLQGQYIPVCLGDFKPRVAYWYHGRLMAQMMILSWSGTRLQHAIHDGNSRFFHQERDRALTTLRSRGVIHCESEWRNMLWDDLSGRLVVIDLEDVKWLKRPRALESVSANTRRTRCVRAMKYKPGLERVDIPQHGSTLSL
ncbi:hypothetical protein AAWM_08464 [Aspergillus awamori]|uniref:Protein kinase domain-containing protein n=1 Tax=Aspergillus awamori TaxID=105351 RepID=A0A401L241_ASPAW|nr:hypothetical protein AAWM_08464 [Aspergillus awamori]